MADATGEAKEPLRVAFDRRLKLEFHGAKITSDGGLLAYRELDDALGLTARAASALAEGRCGRNIRHRLLGLLRQAVYGRLAGYEDVNDAERLARDPAMRAIVGREGAGRPAASTSQMGRFETEWLTTEANLAALADLSGIWIDRVHERRPPDGIILDMDSSESPTYGAQEGTAWNGHFRCTCYHPLFAFNQFGDLERCSLRPGNVHSAEGWRDVLEPVIARYRERGCALYFRGDAGFAKPELYELLEAEGIGYAIRLPANRVLQERIGHLLTRPVGRPPKKPQVFFASFTYQAQSWTTSRRVVAKVEWHQGELYPRVGFIITNLKRPAERISKFYNGRGTAEQWIKEGKLALRWTRLSCRAFRDNAVRLQLFALAYNLANFLRSLAVIAMKVVHPERGWETGGCPPSAGQPEPRMNIHKNARTTPHGRLLMIRRVLDEKQPARHVAAELGISERTVRKWLARWRAGGEPALNDRSSAPARSPRRLPLEVTAEIERLRRQRLTGPQIARRLGLPLSTVGGILRRLGLGRLAALEPRPPVVRYQRARPGELLHIDSKKLGRIAGIGHRITGRRSGMINRHRGLGWEALHVAIDDASRLSYSEILPDERKASATAFLDRALGWFARHGVAVERVMTDNGSAYRSHAFRRACAAAGLRHLRTRPYTPRTNGKAERFIQTVMRECAYARPFASSQERAVALPRWLHLYNVHRPHAALAGRPPITRLAMNNLLGNDS